MKDYLGYGAMTTVLMLLAIQAQTKFETILFSVIAGLWLSLIFDKAIRTRR